MGGKGDTLLFPDHAGNRPFAASALPLPVSSLGALLRLCQLSPALVGHPVLWAGVGGKVGESSPGRRGALFSGSATFQPHRDLQVLCFSMFRFFLCLPVSFELVAFSEPWGSPASALHTSKSQARSLMKHFQITVGVGVCVHVCVDGAAVLALGGGPCDSALLVSGLDWLLGTIFRADA